MPLLGNVEVITRPHSVPHQRDMTLPDFMTVVIAKAVSLLKLFHEKLVNFKLTHKGMIKMFNQKSLKKLLNLKLCLQFYILEWFVKLWFKGRCQCTQVLNLDGQLNGIDTKVGFTVYYCVVMNTVFSQNVTESKFDVQTSH